MDTVKVLLVDDEEGLLQATKLYLEKTNRTLRIATATSAKSALIMLVQEPFDIIVSDYQMPEMNGLEFLEKVKEQEYDIPFIVFTGKGREEVAIQALNLGADYYLQKGGDPKSQFRELINLIEKSVEKRKSDISVRKSEEKFSKAFQFSLNGIVITRFSDQVFLDVNDNFLKTVGYSRDEIIGKNSSELNLWARKEDYEFYYKQLIEVGEIADFETLIVGKNGLIIPLQISATLIDIEGELCILSISRDIFELTKAIEDSKENEQKYRVLFEESPVALLNLDMLATKRQLEKLAITNSNQFFAAIKNQPYLLTELISVITILDVNKPVLDLIGADTREELLRFFDHDYIMKNIDLFSKLVLNLLLGETVFEEEFFITNLKGEKGKIILRVTLAPNTEKTWSKVFVTTLDITQRAQAESNLRKERQAFRIIADAAGSSKNVSDLCNKILKGLMEVLEFEFGTIRLVNHETQMLEPFSVLGTITQFIHYLKPISIKEKDNNLIKNLLNKKVFFIHNAKQSRMKDTIFVKELDLSSYIFCPLLDSKNSIIGSLQLGSSKLNQMLEDDRVFFEIIAGIFSSILERELAG